MNDWHWFYQAGEGADKRGEFAAAAEYFRQAAALAPDLPVLHSRLGFAKLELGDWAGAAAAFRSALDLDNKYAIAYRGLGIAWQQGADPQEAETCLRESLRLRPTSSGYVYLGNLFLSQDRSDEAEQCFALSLQLKGASEEAHYNLGRLFALKNEHLKAMNAFECALAVDPNYSLAHSGLALAFYRLGRYDEAADHAMATIGLGNAEALPHLVLGLVYASKGARAAAKRCLESALVLDLTGSPCKELMAALESRVQWRDRGVSPLS